MRRARIDRTLVVGVVAAAALLGVACGGDDDAGSASPSDLDGYVRTLCQAQNTFNAGLGAALFGRSSQLSEEEALEVLAEPLRAYGDTVRDAPVPEEVRDYHDAFVAAIDRAQEAVEAGDPTAFGDDGQTGALPTPSDGLRDRLLEAADGIGECDGVSLFAAG